MKNFNRIETIIGNKYYYLNNHLHRLDGPAIEYSDRYKVWYLNDEIQFNLNQLNDHGLIIPSTIEDIQRTKFLLDNIYMIPKEKWNDNEYIDMIRVFY